MHAAVFKVTVAPDGDSFDCPVDRPILDAAHAANILIAYSCRGGQCGSCKGRLLDGQVEYPAGMPDALNATDIEAGYVLFCSARAASDLKIELLRPDLDADSV